MSSKQRGRGRPNTLAAVGIGLVLAGAMAGCGRGSGTSADPASTTVAPTSTLPPAESSPTAAGSTPTSTLTATPTAAGRSLPVSVQSDAAMRAAGNSGPSSTILVPASCTVTASTATAAGTYRGGLAPEVYARYGDVVDLYVYGPPRSGYGAGIQLAAPFTAHAPAVGGNGPWAVTVPLDQSLLRDNPPVRCMVAAQPTHDFQGAPSAY